MTTSKFDMAYGRRGGRIAPFTARGADPACDVCGRPVISGMPRHTQCAPDENQLALFNDEAAS